ncbi:hypothetical protein, partial [Salmonella sp. SAL4443]|uniref:hypothetical protein n=1 Tax=Salmonella sp. SAL4443 TaxID=3159898 RepID=UPI00397E0D00
MVPPVRRSVHANAMPVGVALLALRVLACARPAPGTIVYDADACDWCRMTISDPSYAAQLVTRTG